MPLPILGILGALMPVAEKVFDRVLPDEKAKAEAMAQMQTAMMQHSAEIEKAAASVVLAEAKGESWLQRNWRPMLMCLFGYIVAHNYVLVPVLGLTPTPMPDHLWELLKIGIGGYIVSRGAEKGIKVWKDG